ncbi:MAG: winged helix-turn-helix domain-containing protein [Acidobacteriia bacterium]|nr:winged helix-turn-helix domain-containing protein [Terriglobia bacterium]
MPNIVRFDCYEVDLSAGQLYKHGIKISLRDKSFQVLVTLLEHPGEVVTRDDLRRQLWREEVFVDFDNNLNTAIARLREALNDSAEHPHYIETLPKRGYRFLENVSKPPKAAEQRTGKRARMLVLPFVNMSGEPTQEYFSDAITDEIITTLASLAPEQLAVIARTTAMHYKGSHKDVARIGRELSVDYVVEGGVRRSDGQVGINVQLIQARDQTHLFAKKYNAELTDLFDVEGSIAQAIATHVDITPQSEKAPSGSVKPAARKPTKDLAAYDAYIRGRYHLYRHPEGLPKARELFEEAITRDPNFALAYDGLAEVYWWMGFMGFAPPKEAFSAGVFPALRAIEIDNSLAEAHALLGVFRKELDYNWPEVQREMARALELNPASPLSRFRNATSGLMPQGRLTEAVAELETVLEYDPMDLNVRSWIAVMHWFGRNYDRAVEQLRLVLEVDPNYPLGHLVLGQTRTMEHKFEEAIAALRKAVELYGGAPMVLGWLGLALAESGNVAEARTLFEHLRTVAAHAYVPASDFAWIHIGLGEIDQAFSWLERAIDERDPMIVPIKSYPFLDPLRNDPRFAALLHKMNLGT